MNSTISFAPNAGAFRFLAALALLGAGRLAATEDLPGVSSSATRPVVPVLIRNPYGPLVRVIIEVGKEDPGDAFPRYDLRLTSMTFILDGTDDLGDIATLSLLSTGPEEDLRVSRRHTAAKVRKGLSQPEAVGQPTAPAETVTFRADAPLRAGKNVFWLACHLKDSANLLHRLCGTCTAVGTSGGWLTPADGSPGVRQRIGVALRKGGDDGVDTYAIPCVTTTPKGTLLSVYDMRWNYPGHDLQDHITSGLSRSTDGGQTWEPVRVIFDMGRYGDLPPEKNGCSDPGIIVDQQTGEAFAFVIWMHGKTGHHQWVGNGSEPGFEIGHSPQFLMTRSTDDGRTWSKPENMTRKWKKEAWWLLTTSPQHGIQLADGTLVMPVEGRDEKGKEFATIMTSSDHGANWTVGSPISGMDECQAVQLGDGSIMLNMRNEIEDDTFLYRTVYVTRDLGRTWKPHATNGNTLIEPNCNASLLRVDLDPSTALGAGLSTSLGAGKTGRHVLLFTNPHGQVRGRRVNQTIQVSFDDGKTWPRDHYVPIDEDLQWGYPSLTRIGEDRIGIVYGGSQADVTFQVLSLKELLHP